MARQRRSFSKLDMIAGAGAQFLTNACITVVTPTALHSAEQRDDASPLTSSGIIAGSTAFGMMVSLLVAYTRSSEWLDGKGPFRVLSFTMLLGSGLYLVGELRRWPVESLVLARLITSLGFGAVYATKRRASVEDLPRRREYLFLLLELASSSGMACGPVLAGLFAYLMPSLSLLGPPICMIALVTMYLLRLESSEEDRCFFDDAVDAASADEQQSLYKAKQDHQLEAGVHANEHANGLAKGADVRAASETGETGEGETGAVGEFGGSLGRGNGLGNGLSNGLGSGMEDELLDEGMEEGASEAPAPLWASAAVTLACLSFGIGRNFLKFGFESAMVVVYDKQFHFSVDAAGMLAGSCALSGLVSVALYRRFCRRVSGKRLLLMAEGLALASSVFMALTGAVRGGVRVRRHLQLTLATLASVLFYPAMYIGAAQGNSRPLDYAHKGHRLLSRDAIVAQQDLFQTTIGKGLGMVVCRQALDGTNQLATLGKLFVGVVCAQFVVMAVGWDPQATVAAAKTAAAAAKDFAVAAVDAAGTVSRALRLVRDRGRQHLSSNPC